MSDDVEDIGELIEAARKIDLFIGCNRFKGFPEKDNQIFRIGDDPLLNACIQTFSSDITGYLMGYKHAAGLLFRMTYLTHSHVDSILYPMAFLYRHYVELKLKFLILRWKILEYGLHSGCWKEKLDDHGLLGLWENFKPALSKICVKGEDINEVSEGVESYIKQIDEIDNRSFSFRYSRNLTRTKVNIQKEKYKYINIAVLAEGMEKLIYFLDCCDHLLGELEESSEYPDGYWFYDVSI